MTDELENKQVVDEEVEQPKIGTPQEEMVEEPEFVLDENGNLQWNTDEFSHLEEKDSPKEEEPLEEQPEQDEGNEEPVETDEEPTFKVKIDGEDKELTQEELVRGYLRQADYTRKTQALAEERKRLEESARQYNPNYQAQTPDPRQSDEQLNAVAKRIAMQKLGLESEDDLSELNIDHTLAVFEARQALENQQRQVALRQQSIDNLESQLRSEEPQYDEIMQGAQERMANLPMKEFKRLQEAYLDGNPEPLREFFRTMQKDYYAKTIQKTEQKKKTSVPKVISTNNTPVDKTTPRKRVDFEKFGHLSAEQKAQKLIEWGLV